MEMPVAAVFESNAVGDIGLKVVIAQDFIRHGGAEQVLEQMHALWPDATIWTLFEEKNSAYADWDIRSSWLQSVLPPSRYRWPLPLYPGMVDRLPARIDWRGVDLLVTSSVSFMKNLRAPSGIPHLCYIHRPAMFAYDRQDVFFSGYPAVLRPLLRSFCRRFVAWDQLHADNPDLYLANSDYIGAMVKQVYRRDSVTLYPPVQIESFEEAGRRIAPGDFYFSASRLESYKRVDLVIEACNQLALPLKIAGRGPMLDTLRARAGPTVEFLGYVNRQRICELMAQCRAFVLPSEEDFGIATIEAMAAGRPVVALGKAGPLETVRDGETGILFAEQRLADVVTALRRCEERDWNPEVMHAAARAYSATNFRAGLAASAEHLLARFRANPESRLIAEGSLN